MARRLYVARDANVTVVSQGRVRMSGSLRVDRSWGALVERVAEDLATRELRARSSGASGEAALGEGALGEGALGKGALGKGALGRGAAARAPTGELVEAVTGKPRALSLLTDAAVVVLPPVIAGSITAVFAPVEASFAVGGGLLLATSFLAQPLRSRLASRAPRPGRYESRTLISERAAFQRAVILADRISETWPALGSLVDVSDAEQMLAEALWEIADLLSLRQSLTTVLAELSRPDFVSPSAPELSRPDFASPAAPELSRPDLASSAAPELSRPDFATSAAAELNAQIRATKAALSELDIELARREANLRRADEAGRDFIREQEMRQAIQSAEDSLRASPDFSAAAAPDAGTKLADHTRSVLAAYRELTKDQ